MLSDWFETSAIGILAVILSAIGVYILVIALTRLAGLRSFSKMSSFDFVMTVAIGSIVASTVLLKDPPLFRAAFALAAVFGLQYGIAWLRERSSDFSSLVDNEPLLLMDGPNVLEENLKKARVTKDDLRAKLREANVLDLSQVRAVVLETTGDISVLHGEADGPALNPDLLRGVHGADRLTS
ncbi:MAG: DUF421 domain-containing protein [Rhodothermales bacterium]